MSKDMKLIMENWRNNVIEEDWSMLNEVGLLNKIKGYFNKK